MGINARKKVYTGSQGGLQGCTQGALRVSAETCRQEEMREAEEICGQAERHGQVVIKDNQHEPINYRVLIILYILYLYLINYHCCISTAISLDCSWVCWTGA